MGQQQLLLIMLSVLLVAIAIAVGISMFSVNAINQKRNELINECTLLASEAQLFYVKIKEHGGGGRTFTGWKVPPQYATTEAGTITAVVAADKVILTAIGNEIVTDSDSVRVEVTIFPKYMETTVIH